jgi:hypothetical protein
LSEKAAERNYLKFQAALTPHLLVLLIKMLKLQQAVSEFRQKNRIKISETKEFSFFDEKRLVTTYFLSKTIKKLFFLQKINFFYHEIGKNAIQINVKVKIDFF